MNRFTLMTAIVAAACGGSPKSTSLENKPTAEGKSPIAQGAYACGFLYEGKGDMYGPFRCGIDGNRLTKPDGMEPFTGVLTATATGAHLEGTIGPRCDMAMKCGLTFSVELAKSPSGSYAGKVTHTGDPADWWLGTATFEIRDAGMGGDQYGKAFPPNLNE